MPEHLEFCLLGLDFGSKHPEEVRFPTQTNGNKGPKAIQNVQARALSLRLISTPGPLLM